MDGNGRWAKSRSLPRIEGHRRGGDAVRETLSGCQELGIRFLTLFAFSSENWSRPDFEVRGLMELLVTFLKKETENLVEKKVRLHVVGQWEELPKSVRRELKLALDATARFDDWHLTLALNYGSRQEVAIAAQAYAEAVRRGDEDPKKCSWGRFRRYLFTSELPDPDLIIRTSGEFRLSNFLLLQSAYSELYFSPVHWPDFTREHLREAVESFKQRERRYGKTGEQLRTSVAATI